MRADCNEALALDPSCAQARLCLCIAADTHPDATLDLLFDVERGCEASLGPLTPDAAHDAWDDVFVRPRLRVKAAIARSCLESARYRMASAVSSELLGLSPADELGARHSCALALSRLEDEEGFDALDARVSRRGDSWAALGRVILLFKLGRLAAARRALRGFDRLCEGGVYALLRPVLIDTYMPDRPLFAPYSFEEATLAVHEADPIIVDVPDLPAWVESQQDMLARAKAFADRSGFDW